MTPGQLAKLDKELSAYLDYLTEGMGRPERRRALSWYLTGLLLDGESKTIVSMAARLVENDSEAEAMRQRLQQCVTISAWADEEIRRRLASRLQEVLRPDAYVIDDTGFPKKRGVLGGRVSPVLRHARARRQLSGSAESSSRVR